MYEYYSQSRMGNGATHRTNNPITTFLLIATEIIANCVVLTNGTWNCYCLCGTCDFAKSIHQKTNHQDKNK
jgi:hypothetical protein